MCDMLAPVMPISEWGSTAKSGVTTRDQSYHAAAAVRRKVPARAPSVVEREAHEDRLSLSLCVLIARKRGTTRISFP